MKSILVVPAYILCVVIIILVGSRYVSHKPNEIESFCHFLEPISNILDKESTIRINNNFGEEWTYKVTFCLNQVKIVEDDALYLLSLTSEAAASKIFNYEHLETLTLEGNFTHLYKAIK